MKKLIKMLSYSKEGRNIIRQRRKEYNTPFALTLSGIIQKKKKKCYLSFIFNILFFFFIK